MPLKPHRACPASSPIVLVEHLCVSPGQPCAARSLDCRDLGGQPIDLRLESVYIGSQPGGPRLRIRKRRHYYPTAHSVYQSSLANSKRDLACRTAWLLQPPRRPYLGGYHTSSHHLASRHHTSHFRRWTSRAAAILRLSSCRRTDRMVRHLRSNRGTHSRRQRIIHLHNPPSGSSGITRPSIV